MRGLLIYDRIGAKRNEWFIDRLIACASQRGCELSLIIYEDGFNNTLDVKPDFAIVRTIHPELNRMLEDIGVPSFNNYVTSRIANDKWKTCLLASELGISVMDTLPLSSVDDPELLPYPIVIKSTNGHGGSEVFLANNPEECKQAVTLLAQKSAIVQRMCDEPGVDMRVYVLGGKILRAVKRTSQVDFRSNFSLGGKVDLAAPTKEMEEAISRLQSVLKSDLVGVDFIRHAGRWVLNEIEDVVGTRMLYSLTDIDIADKYIEYIINKINSLA